MALIDKLERSLLTGVDISAHDFSYAIHLLQRGKINRAEFLQMFSLDKTDEQQLDDLITYYQNLASEDKAHFRNDVESVIGLMQRGKLTKSQSKTQLGLR